MPEPTSKWQNLPIVAIAGTIGGVLAWLIVAANATTVGAHWKLDLPVAMLGGAFAAIGGVFLLANTDTTRLAHCVTFAAFCGLSWQPVVETGKNLINQATTNKRIADAKEKIGESLGAGVADSADIQKLATNTNKVSENLSSVTNPDVHKDALKTVSKAVDKLEAAALENPEAVSALEDIGKQASNSGSKTIEAAAKESLKNISTNDSASQPIKQQASTALVALMSRPSG